MGKYALVAFGAALAIGVFVACVGDEAAAPVVIDNLDAGPLDATPAPTTTATGVTDSGPPATIDAGADAGPGSRIIFVTTAVTTGAMTNGVDGFDAMCQAEATARASAVTRSSPG